jgi:hypothetical protein
LHFSRFSRTIQKYKNNFSVITGSHLNHKILIEPFFIRPLNFKLQKTTFWERYSFEMPTGTPLRPSVHFDRYGYGLLMKNFLLGLYIFFSISLIEQNSISKTFSTSALGIESQSGLLFFDSVKNINKKKFNWFGSKPMTKFRMLQQLSFYHVWISRYSPRRWLPLIEVRCVVLSCFV